MQIVQPKEITDSILTSDVAITEALWTSGTYNEGDKRYVTTTGYEYDYFECLSTTTDDPVTGFLKETPTWKRLGKINKWKMFDKRQGTQTVNEDEINIYLEPSGIIDSLAILNTACEYIDVTITDTEEGVVYEEIFQMIDNSGVFNWYTYFFEEYVTKTDLTILDLPSFSDTTINVKFYYSSLGSDVSVGELLIGNKKFIGFTQLATNIGIDDFSRKEYNPALDYFEIEERSYVKRANFDVQLETADITRVQRLLAEVRSSPTLYIGDEQQGALILYGFYRNFDIVFSSPSLSSCSIEVEGL